VHETGCIGDTVVVSLQIGGRPNEGTENEMLFTRIHNMIIERSRHLTAPKKNRPLAAIKRLTLCSEIRLRDDVIERNCGEQLKALLRSRSPGHLGTFELTYRSETKLRWREKSVTPETGIRAVQR
jgi:hypothetical protein